MSLLDHLEELRGRLFWIFGSVAAAAIAGWFVFDRVVELLLEPARPYLKDLTDGKLVFTGPLEAFTLRFKVAFYIGFLLAFPIVLFHIWRFISPGLHRNERKWALPFIGSGIVLFGGGVLFAWFTHAAGSALAHRAGDHRHERRAAPGREELPRLRAAVSHRFRLRVRAAR